MQCPSCNTTLARIQYEGLPICSCPGCNGEFVSLSQFCSIIKRRDEKFDKKKLFVLK
jgi:Zn-finger nucleic acid-binding protein